MNTVTQLFHRSTSSLLVRPLALPSTFRYSSLATQNMDTVIHTPRDPNTLSNYNNFLTTHTVANFEIDFHRKRLVGNVSLHLKSITNAETKKILLDTSHLDINHVTIDGTAPKWDLTSQLEPYGKALSIELEHGVEHGKGVQVDVCDSCQMCSP